jgi:hypothetical protein
MPVLLAGDGGAGQERRGGEAASEGGRAVAREWGDDLPAAIPRRAGAGGIGPLPRG